MSVNPIDHPEQYEAIVLAGERSPGVAKLSGTALDHGWAKQEPKGSSGGETIQNGTKLVEFTVELYIWRDDQVDHFARWVAWRPILRRPIAKGASKALDIYHPQLDELGVTSVVCSKEGSLVPDGKGGATVALSFIQYAPPQPKAAGKPAGSSSKEGTSGPGAENKPPKKQKDPNQDLKDEVSKLTDQFNNPEGGT